MSLLFLEANLAPLEWHVVEALGASLDNSRTC